MTSLHSLRSYSSTASADPQALPWIHQPPTFLGLGPAASFGRNLFAAGDPKLSPMRCSRLSSSKDKSLGRLNVACSDFVTDGCVLTYAQRRLVRFAGDLAASLNLDALLVELLWQLVSGNKRVESLLAYLAQREEIESDSWMKDDLRIAWLTCLYASRGYEKPHVAATCQILGLHPDKVFRSIEERRKALLGPLYSEFAAASPTTPQGPIATAAGGSASGELSLPPKKSPQRVQIPVKKEEQA